MVRVRLGLAIHFRSEMAIDANANSMVSLESMR